MTASILLERVGKNYVKYDDDPMLSGATRLWQRTRRSEFVALRDVDLKVHPGESVGVIGRNGAGKSTLLSLLCGVTAPTSGRVEVRGRVAPLISVGVGFHPEMTGRENVFVNATILGLSRRQIEQRFDAIVDFAEIPDFIDTPVKFYSSGMFVRLGFAVAVEVQPDVLLVDEVLAVGDLPFQIKCYERMASIRESGTTVVVVTHNLSSVRSFCDRGVVIDSGGVVYDGSTAGAISAYHKVLGTRDITDEQRGLEPDQVTINGFELLDAAGHPTRNIDSGSHAVLRVSVRALRDVENPLAWVGIRTDLGTAIYSDTNVASPYPALRAGEQATYDVTLRAGLAGGSYVADASIHRLGEVAGTTVPLARAPELRFYVAGRGHVHGVVDLAGDFRVAEAQ